MHKLYKLASVGMLLLLIVGCSNGSNGSTTDNTTSNNTDEPDAAEKQPTTEENTGSSLVAYFSHTGNTEEVAEYIQEQTESDIFQIEPLTPYPSSSDELRTLGTQELEEGIRPEMTGGVDNFDQYTTIYIGYPIWFDNPPMLIATFLETYDIEGKTIIPFCTAAGSEYEDTLPMMQSLTSNATLLEGIKASMSDTNAIDSWLEETSTSVN